MKTSILEKFTKRDYSGSLEDEYKQGIFSLYMNFAEQGQEEAFLTLLERAETEQKKVVVDPNFEKEMENVLYNEIPLNKLILV
ncbi:MAG: hypothetical protein KGV44_09285 [Flavobacteriaceae bacterium]|nr:hypothetical protein [Flavobacteriaceae bacterium]